MGNNGIMRMQEKGQVSMEYALVIGFSLLILIPTIIIAQNYSSSYQDNIAVHEAQRAVDFMATYADTVYLEGSPARRTIRVNLPGHIENISTIGRSIIIGFDDESQIVYATAEYANITWDATYRGKGSYDFIIQSEGNIVRIKDAP